MIKTAEEQLPTVGPYYAQRKSGNIPIRSSVAFFVQPYSQVASKRFKTKSQLIPGGLFGAEGFGLLPPEQTSLHQFPPGAGALTSDRAVLHAFVTGLETYTGARAVNDWEPQ